MGAEPFVYLHLETLRTAYEVGGWYHEKLGVSVAVALTANRLRVFTEKNINKVAALLANAELVIGYNLVDFDFKVLSGYRGMKLHRVRHLDLKQSAEDGAKVRVMLGSLTSATLGTVIEGGGLEMVSLWKEGAVEKVVERCCNVVLAIKALHEYGCDQGHVFYFPSESKHRKRIEVDWVMPSKKQRTKSA